MHKGHSFITDSGVNVLAYDVSIDDLDLRKKAVLEFKTLKLAEQKLGVGQNVLKRALTTRTRVYSPLMDRQYAIRLKPKK
jgi:hypothetical protein